MDEKSLRTKVQELIDKFERVKTQGKYKSYNEENTKKDFILPLFRALGWNVDDSEEVKAEEKVSKKRVDYAFRINGVVKFYLEAKPLREYLTEPKYAKQAIEYAWNKSVTWAILCNFEGIRVFNAEWKWDEKRPTRNSFLDLRYTDFLGSSFQYLTWLSKESFEQGILDKNAAALGKKTKKLPIDKQLLADFTEYRNILTKDILKHNQSKNLSQDDLDEIVQRILDRLIFIRTCEDKEIESEKLESLVRMYGETEGKLYKELNLKFREYDEGYNSKLFREHLCEDVIISNDALKQVILGTYQTRDLSVAYDFSAIGADVLGNIYEQYLGHILKKTSQRAKLTNGKAHRKEQGIYYTPTYIVDYIVRNTVGEKLKQRKVKVDELKILDPACGSGSFLLKAFDVICEHATKKEGTTLQARFDDSSSGKLLKRKTELLKNCIFGVDLDSQAVEITQLTLLLKLAEKRHRLPTLQENIKCGNSLIDDSMLAGDKAFKWEEQFRDILDKGGFDVIIGNPPYVKARDTKDPVMRKFIEESGQYKTPYKMWDLYIVFVERSLQLLKPNGVFAMIIPDTIGIADYTQKLVDLIIKEYSLYQIDFFPDIEIFEGVGVRNKIIFVKKTTNVKKCKRIIHENKMENVKILDVIDNRKSEIFKLTTSKIDFDFKNTIPLGHICYVSYGARFNSDKADPIKFKKSDLVSATKDKIHNHIYTEGKYLERYYIKKELYVEWDTDRCPRRLVRPTFPELYPPDKLLMSRQKRITAFSNKGHTCDNTVIVGVLYNDIKSTENAGINKYLKNIKLDRKIGEEFSLKFNLKYLLSILNSKLIAYSLKVKSRSKIDSYPDDWKNIPIKNIKLSEQKPFIVLADKMLLLNIRLNEIGDKKTDERARIEDEIKKTDAEIDELVYKLYDLNKEEIVIVEESLKK